MRTALIFLGILLAACGSRPSPEQQTSAPKPAPKPKPPDESRRFPKANLTSTEVVSEGIWGKTSMPGGTVARYRKGSSEYEMFVAKLPNPTDAAIRLLDWKRAMSDAKLIPSFGGYFGTDGDKPVFVFAKGGWLAGIRGLKEKEADMQARLLAAQLD